MCPSQSLVEVDGEKAKDEQQAEMKKKNPAMQFLLEQVVVWLSEQGREDTEHLVEMLFSSLCCCSSQETTRILNHVTTVLRRSWSSGTRTRRASSLTSTLSFQMEFHWRIILQIIKRVCVIVQACINERHQPQESHSDWHQSSAVCLCRRAPIRRR